MKMKSKLFGNGAKLALTLLAMCGMFASCYEKDEIDVPKVTDPTATTYQVAGIVTDAESNAVMDGVTVTNVTNSKSMTTAADGKYVLEAKVGETNVVTFAKSGYKTVTSSVFVTKQENGSIVAYTIDAKMEKGKETKPTHYFWHRQSKPFHIDYCFSSAVWMERLENVAVGKYKDWAQKSDHCPVMIDFK